MIRLTGLGDTSGVVAQSVGMLSVGSGPHCAWRAATLEPEHVRVAPTPSGYSAFVVGAETVVTRWRGGERRSFREGEPMELLAGDELTMVERGVRIGVDVEQEHDLQVLSSRPISEVNYDVFALGLSQERARDVATLARAVSSVEEMDVLLAVICDAALQLVPGAHRANIVLHDVDLSGAFLPVYAAVREHGRVESRPASQRVLQRAFDERAAILFADASRPDISQIAVPLWKGLDVFGVLEVETAAGTEVLTSEDVDALALYSSGASLALAHVRLVAALRRTEARLDAENRHLKNSARSRRENDPATPTRILGESEIITRVVESAMHVAPTKTAVLIYGETGVGKERVANFIHESSPRRGKMLVAVNCSTLPTSTIEAELFGYVRGAFAGANDDKQGLFEVADGGTLFLDEVGDLPLGIQAKLLRVLQDGEVRRLGAASSRRVDVRLITASNRDLAIEVREDRFRADLYYRLGAFPVYVPALRERRLDIPLLARTFLRRYAQEFQRETEGFSPATLQLLQAYAWPGNVRELQSEVQRLVIQTPAGMLIGEEYLSPAIRESVAGLARLRPAKGTLVDMLDSVERTLLAEALAEHDGDKTSAARALGIAREEFVKKLKHFGLTA